MFGIEIPKSQTLAEQLGNGDWKLDTEEGIIEYTKHMLDDRSKSKYGYDL